MEKSSMKSGKDKNSFKSKLQKSRAKFLSSYYGNPIKDMKLIAITGSTGKSIVAHFVHEILKASGEHVAILASDTEIKASVLHKFLADAWKAGANYVVVTAPATSLSKNVFYDLPITVAALTDYVPSKIDDAPAEDFVADETTLFDMKPLHTIVNADDLFYPQFSSFVGQTSTLTFGKDYKNNLIIESSKLYKKGVEATFAIGSSHFTAASFLTGEPIVSYMACAAAIATALQVSPTSITDGLANYNPESAE